MTYNLPSKRQAVMNWTEEKPKETGFYWCHQHGHTRMVEVWKYSPKYDKGNLFTNEDGCSTINDELYLNAYWYGPIQPPDFTNQL
jgi:hypothetical protein